MQHFNKEKILDKEITVKGRKWERIDEWENTGVLYWSRPIHHDERDWNRHDVEIEGESNYPSCTIELTKQEDNIFGVSVGRTIGPNEDNSGMDGVLEGTTEKNIESANEIIRSYMKRYSDEERIRDSY